MTSDKCEWIYQTGISSYWQVLVPECATLTGSQSPLALERGTTQAYVGRTMCTELRVSASQTGKHHLDHREHCNCVDQATASCLQQCYLPRFLQHHSYMRVCTPQPAFLTCTETHTDTPARWDNDS